MKKPRGPSPAAATGPEWVSVRCRRCGEVLARPLRRMPAEREPARADDMPAMPLGFFRVVAQDFWTGAEPSSLLVHPRDAEGLLPTGNRQGCCGPTGMDGPNLACPAGHPVAIEATDCWAPHIVLFLPSRALWVETEPGEPRGQVLVVGKDHPLLSLEAFASWAHTALDAADWHGNDLGALFRAWLTLHEAESAGILWLQSEASARAGVPIGEVEAAVDDAQRGAPARRLALWRA